MLPGAGRKWWHAGDPGDPNARQEASAEAEGPVPALAAEGDVNELPWQVIFLSNAARAFSVEPPLGEAPERHGAVVRGVRAGR